MKKFSERLNYCDVSISSKENRRHQIKRVYCEEVHENQYTLVLVPKQSDPDIMGLCFMYNMSCKMDESQVKPKPVTYRETENQCVRVIVPELTAFIDGLLSGLAISEGDDKKILSMCSRVRNTMQEFQEYTDDDHQPFIPKWTSK